MLKKKRDFVVAAMFFAFGSLVLYMTYGSFVIDDGGGGGSIANSAFYPRAMAVSIIFLSLLLGVVSLLRREDVAKPNASIAEVGNAVPFLEEPQSIAADKLPRGSSLLIALSFILYTIALDVFGYVVVTPIYLAILFKLFDVRSWISSILLSLILTFAIYFFFSMALDIILPQGRYSVVFG